MILRDCSFCAFGALLRVNLSLFFEDLCLLVLLEYFSQAFNRVFFFASFLCSFFFVYGFLGARIYTLLVLIFVSFFV